MLFENAGKVLQEELGIEASIDIEGNLNLPEGEFEIETTEEVDLPRKPRARQGAAFFNRSTACY